MNIILVGSLTSPYVRKLRLLLTDIPYQFKAINYTEKEGNDYLKSINPINKIPVLIDGEKTIFDSRVIFNYLSNKHQWTKLSIDEENILTAIDGVMDTSVNLFMLKRGGMDLNTDNSFIIRQKERVPEILNFLNPWVKTLNEKNLAHWNILSMSLYCYLDWASFREMIDLNQYPEHLAFKEKFKNIKGIQETEIPK